MNLFDKTLRYVIWAFKDVSESQVIVLQRFDTVSKEIYKHSTLSLFLSLVFIDTLQPK